LRGIIIKKEEKQELISYLKNKGQAPKKVRSEIQAEIIATFDPERNDDWKAGDRYYVFCSCGGVQYLRA